MPTYEYLCEKCGTFEFVQKITEDALKTCPTCGGTVKRLISAAAFHLKGTGWYKTDYGSSGSSASSASSGSKSPSSTSPTESSSTAPSSESSPSSSSAEATATVKPSTDKA